MNVQSMSKIRVYLYANVMYSKPPGSHRFDVIDNDSTSIIFQNRIHTDLAYISTYVGANLAPVHLSYKFN